MPDVESPLPAAATPREPVARPPRLSRLASWLGVGLAFGWPLLLLIPGVSGHRITSAHDDLVSIALKWLVTLTLGWLAFAIQRRTPRELGLVSASPGGVGAALAASLAAFVAAGVVSRSVAMPSSVTDLRAIAALPLALRVVVVTTAALTEEFIYRGYAIETLATLTGRRGVAALVSWVLFGVSHAGLYGWSAALLIPISIGGVLTVLYLVRRDLGSCVLVHAIMDGTMLLVVPALSRAR